MKKLKVIIADNNKDYSQRLFSALEKKYNNLDLTLSDKIGFSKMLQKRIYDVALFDVSVYSNDINLKNAKMPLVLLDEDDDNSIKLANSIGKYVKKYQHIDGMYKEIIGFFSEMGDGQVLNSGSASSQLICFYSPAGGTGKTTISLSASEMIANRGIRVLYLNFEDVASYGLILGAKTGKGIDEVIYQLDKGINMPMKISSLLQKSKSGVMFFNMFSNIMDVTEIKSDKISAFIDVLMTAGICDCIIVDMNTSLSGINSVILDKADKIILVETPDSICVEKISRMNFHKNIFEDYFSKMAVVKNKTASSGDESITGLEVVSVVPKMYSDSTEKIIEEITKKAKLDIARIIS